MFLSNCFKDRIDFQSKSVHLLYTENYNRPIIQPALTILTAKTELKGETERVNDIKTI